MTEVFGIDTGLNFDAPTVAGFTVYLLWIAAFLLLAVLGAVLIWYFNQKKLFNTKIVGFENISGKGWGVGFKDKARLLRVSPDGTSILWLKKKKIAVTAYGRKMNENEFWFAVGQDGGWYNIVLGDLDAKMGILDIEPVDRDIKYITVAMLKEAEKEYGDKPKWWDKYGMWVFSILMAIIMIAGMSYIIDQISETAKVLAQATKDFATISEPIQRALGHVDSICQGGTGLTQAT
jgi:hypothetical protein